MLAGFHERLMLWGIVEPTTHVRFASDGATVCISTDEMRVIEGARNSDPPPVAIYRVSVDGTTAQLTLTRGGETPIVLAEYSGRSGQKAARRALRDLAAGRQGVERSAGLPWLKSLAAVAVLWMGIRSFSGAPLVSSALHASTPSVGAASLAGFTPAPSAPLTLPALPSGSVTCGDFK